MSNAKCFSVTMILLSFLCVACDQKKDFDPRTSNSNETTTPHSLEDKEISESPRTNSKKVEDNHEDSTLEIEQDKQINSN